MISCVHRTAIAPHALQAGNATFYSVSERINTIKPLPPWWARKELHSFSRESVRTGLTVCAGCGHAREHPDDYIDEVSVPCMTGAQVIGRDHIIQLAEIMHICCSPRSYDWCAGDRPDRLPITSIPLAIVK